MAAKRKLEKPTIHPRLEEDHIGAVDDLDVTAEESAEVTGGLDVTPWSTTHQQPPPKY